ncbi:MAG: YicC/YloC family endoribonuclease [bacterium]
MTGFGTATTQLPGGRLTVEARSVNHRFSEVQIRLPKDLSPLEERTRAVVQGKVHRGRVEVVVTREDGTRRTKAVRVDLELATAYTQALREIAGTVGAAGEVTLAQLAALPDVLRVEDDRGEVETIWPALEAAVAAATDALVAMRTAEGRRMASDLLDRLTSIGRLLDTVNERGSDVVRVYSERLRARLAELLAEVPIDEARIATEIALFAERSDISEELVRLRSHIMQFRQTVDEDGAVGRKLEFILQEMGRETNTIGSKANDLDITRAVIAMKSELESLREQVQNIE